MDAVVRQSEQAIKAGSKSFASAARLFAPEVRDDAVMLYAWCRHCDDVIDGQTLGHRVEGGAEAGQQSVLDRLKAQTEAAIAGARQSDPVFEALARVVKRHGIPARHPLDLLEGFAMDVEGRRYETLEDTLLYCYHVAGVVGVMMAAIMGARGTETLNRAADLGIAFQLTNIARDVGDDARMGRVYLPAEWLRAEGLRPEDIGQDAQWPAVARVVERLLATAEPYYASACIGLRRLPFRSAWAIAAARGIYRDIGRGVRRGGADAWRARVSTSKSTKIFWALFGGLQAAGARSGGRLLPDPPRRGLWTRPGLGDSGS